jgi:hypothetical protein
MDSMGSSSTTTTSMGTSSSNGTSNVMIHVLLYFTKTSTLEQNCIVSFAMSNV